MTTSRWGWLLGVMILESGRGKGTSLNSTCLTPKRLASSVYVHVPEAPCPSKRAMSVTCLFPSLVSVRHRSCMPARASSRICAATCIGLTFRPPALACSASRLSRCRVASLIGTLGCRTQLPSVGLPGRRPCPGTRRAWMVWTIRASRGRRTHPLRCGAPGRPPSRRGRRRFSQCFLPCSFTSVSCPSVAWAPGLLPAEIRSPAKSGMKTSFSSPVSISLFARKVNPALRRPCPHRW